MGFWHKDREPQQPGKTRTGSWLRRKRPSETQAADKAAPAQPPAKAHRRTLAMTQTKTSEPATESQPQPESQRPRLAAAAGASPEQESAPKLGRPRGAVSLPCNNLPELRNIIDPPRLAADDSAPTPCDKVPEPQPAAKSGRRCLSIGPIRSDEPPSEPRPEAGPEPRRARLAVSLPAAPEESSSTPMLGHSRGAITHPCDNPTELQSILEPPASVSEEPAPAPCETTPEEKTPEAQPGVNPAKREQVVAELRARQNFSMALIGGLAVAIIGATAWALIVTATNYQVAWMAVGVGFLVGGAVRTLGRGIDRAFGYTGAALAVFGCLLGKLLGACAMSAGQEGLALVTLLGHVFVKPALIPAALLTSFHPLDLLFYGIAFYEAYRLSFRRVTDAEISRAPCRQASRPDIIESPPVRPS